MLKKLKPNIRKLVLVTIICLVGLGLFFTLRPGSLLPLPADIAKQINFKPVYPQCQNNFTLDTSSFKYQESEGVLTFSTSNPAAKLTITEQKTPANWLDNANNGLHPLTQFKSPLGLVSVTTFTSEKPLVIFGQTAVVNDHGTLMFARSTVDLNNDSWKAFFCAK